ncbi:hypothetical protein [Bacillus fonticola]|uniref:hypothetical protein n=1 Tax=Bacillus fonticola TaxID=2728853 RepID=UPI001D14BB5D|nr:hypothetical protein [Bacillus fonticola]
MKGNFKKVIILLGCLIFTVQAVLYFDVKKDINVFTRETLANMSTSISNDLTLVTTIIDKAIQTKEISYREQLTIVTSYTSIGKEFEYLSTVNTYLRSVPNSTDHLTNYTGLLTNFFAQNQSRFDGATSNQNLSTEEIDKLKWIRENNKLLYPEKTIISCLNLYWNSTP